jgi:oligopeptidase A
MSDTNPLLLNHELPHFDRITPSIARDAIPFLVHRAECDLETLERNAGPSWKTCMEPLLAITEPLDYAWGIISHLHSVMNTPDWRQVHEELQPQIVAFSTRLGQSEPIYQAIRQIRESDTWNRLDEARQRLIRSAMVNAEAAGVGLAPEQAHRMRDILDSLASASTAFSNHLLDATKAFSLTLLHPDDIAGLPPSLLAAASSAAIRAGHQDSVPDSGPWTLTLEAPLFIPFLQYSRRRDLRETLYRAYVTRASSGETDNTPLISQILECRHESAGLLNAGSFANQMMRMRMAEKVEAVDRMIDRLRTAARPAAEREHADLVEFARRQGQAEALMPWDIAFWSERMRKATFAFDDEDLRPYFQFPTVLDALFDLSDRLFGVTIRAADGHVPVWHGDVRYFEILDEGETVIASFYLDPYSRPETKRGGAWMDGARPRYPLPNGTVLPPAAYLVCNQTRPTGKGPSLMTLNEVTTLFHEFGHALHHLLTTVSIPAASGIHNVEWDAIELPSQFMENWCIQERVLRRLSKHIETGESLPAEIMEQVRNAHRFRAGSAMLRQLLFAAIDMELHARYQPGSGRTPNQVKDDIARPYAIIPLLPEDRFLCGFSHIFAGGYPAGYYSYKWAEVLSADAFAAFTEAGLDDPAALAATGRRFRDTILALGGSQHPMGIYKAFRGRDPDPDALLRQCNLC